MSMSTITTVIKVESAFDDPPALRALIERNGPYRTMTSYLPSSALAAQRSGVAGSPMHFRGMWALNGRALVEGAEAVLHNPRFIEAASRLFETPSVTPTNVFVNVNGPMPAMAVHVDIPSFRGANRDRYPMSLLQAMGASGLFEPWRIVEAGAVYWFYDGPGGAFEYWPRGLDGPMLAERPPFENVAIVADNDRMYHRIGSVGDLSAPATVISNEAVISHLEGGGWAVMDCDEERARYGDEQVRISIVWKAKVQPDDAIGKHDFELSPDRVAEILDADLQSKGISTVRPTSPLSDETWINLIHNTYYSQVTVPD
jgi:hypothetical protein